MKPFYLLFICLYTWEECYSQKVIENYVSQKDSLRYGNGKNDLFPYNEKGYSLITPASGIKGTIISLEDDRINLQDTSAKNIFYKQANEAGFAYLHISTGIPVDLFFNEKSLQFIETTLNKVFKENILPQKNIFLLGIMTSGHRALKYIEYCQKNNSAFKSEITGVVLCESALDWVRQWYEGQKQVRDSLTEVGHFEGKLVTYLFEKHLKCNPITNMDKMVKFSPYSYFDTKMKHIQSYKNLAVRAYTFADIDYWFSAPGKGVYDSNYPDMSGIINELKLAGNKKAELVVFQKENKTGLHAKQSSTWSMVDKKELLEWITKQIN
jgi:hypothetical protein